MYRYRNVIMMVMFLGLLGGMASGAVPVQPASAAAEPVATGVHTGLPNRPAAAIVTQLASADPDIHIQKMEYPEIGLTIVGVGKGAKGKPSSDATGGELAYCKLGTGIDMDYNILEERDVFGPGLGIYWGAHYVNLYSDRWCGCGWYEPNDRIFLENINQFHIPHPGDYYYPYWSWYNLASYWSSMPAAMCSTEGIWQAKWWDEGSVAEIQPYTVMYDVAAHALCRDVQSESPYDPIDIQYQFDVTEDQCCSWIHLGHYALNGESDILWKWYGPEGLYTQADIDITDPGLGNWYDDTKVWCSLFIDGYYPASHPGTWRVEVYISDYLGAYEYQWQESFVIGSAAGEPDIRIEPNNLIIDCNEPARLDRPAWTPDDPDALDRVEPQQSTTGPLPPIGVADKTRQEPPAVVRSEKTLVAPGYNWRHGCGPTAVGMVVGYYDTLGYADLYDGPADSQTEPVNQGIASQVSTLDPHHYEDYSLPMDSGQPAPLPDKSEPPAGDEHPHDCIADYMKTSWSSVNNYYGWSWSSHIGPAFTGYVNLRNPAYEPVYNFYSYSGGSLTWQRLTGEIDSGRPMVFLVDTDGNGGTDHFVTVVGYRQTTELQYGCLDTWSPANVIRWCKFAQMTSGQPWGIWGGWTFALADLPANYGEFTIHNDGNADLSVEAIVPAGPADWLSCQPSPPFDIAPQQSQTVRVTVDCALAPCGAATTRLLVLSNDPDESPYPDGVDVTTVTIGLEGDLNHDCCVNVLDLDLLCREWLYLDGVGRYDLVEDDRINLGEFGTLGENWLKCLER